MAKRGSDGKSAGKDSKKRDPLPEVIAPSEDAPRIKTRHGSFDLDDLVLPAWVERSAFKSGGYPYDEPLDDKAYEKELKKLQIELVKLQRHVNDTGLRIVVLFEGRDAAGKGGAISAFRRYLNPRSARLVALPKPTEVERGQWYFQRYVAQLPTSGEMVFFDRSWYNRAGVEPVMGFCTKGEHRLFLQSVSGFESMLAAQGISLFKMWLSIGFEMQLKRFYERRHDPLKIWKLSPIDYAAMHKWDDYTRARNQMFRASHKPETPWTVVRANDKKRARLNVIRHVLSRLAYPGKDAKAVGRTDPLILGGPELVLHG
ncbi:MAG TPA: polyphosphate kinase 2 [Bauldia sp.]|nr:polyphosphate kinase 2 [Bauldia sp.]